jgi:RND family efflux transporter MFP subunit
LLRVQDVSRLRLVVFVPEAEVGGIIPGDKVDFIVPAFPDETFSGIIRRIAHALDARTRTMPVELEVANPSGRLAPGMYAEVEWPFRRSQPSLFVPPLAVASNTERTFVIRVRDGVAEWVDVRRGAAMGNLVEVFGDLAAGDRIALRGTDELRPGTRVTVSEQ